MFKITENGYEKLVADYHKVHDFDNGYSASVVRTAYSYGGTEGLYEVAVLDSSGAVCYHTPITDDVIGYVPLKHLDNILNKIKGLPKNV